MKGIENKLTENEEIALIDYLQSNIFSSNPTTAEEAYKHLKAYLEFEHESMCHALLFGIAHHKDLSNAICTRKLYRLLLRYEIALNAKGLLTNYFPYFQARRSKFSLIIAQSPK